MDSQSFSKPNDTSLSSATHIAVVRESERNKSKNQPRTNAHNISHGIVIRCSCHHVHMSGTTLAGRLQSAARRVPVSARKCRLCLRIWRPNSASVSRGVKGSPRRRSRQRSSSRPLNATAAHPLTSQMIMRTIQTRKMRGAAATAKVRREACWYACMTSVCHVALCFCRRVSPGEGGRQVQQPVCNREEARLGPFFDRMACI